MLIQPTGNELELLKLFWRHGPLSARELHDRIEGPQGWSISTTRTLLERMRAKGLLDREAVHGMAVYSPTGGKVQVLGSAIRNLVRRVLEVNGDLPVNAFSGSALLNEKELAELAELLNEAGDEA